MCPSAACRRRSPMWHQRCEVFWLRNSWPFWVLGFGGFVRGKPDSKTDLKNLDWWITKSPFITNQISWYRYDLATPRGCWMILVYCFYIWLCVFNWGRNLFLYWGRITFTSKGLGHSCFLHQEYCRLSGSDSRIRLSESFPGISISPMEFATNIFKVLVGPNASWCVCVCVWKNWGGGGVFYYYFFKRSIR